MSRLPSDEDSLEHLPLSVIETPSRWLRIARIEHRTPLYFNRMPGGRFNPTSGRFGTLYCARDLVGALAESVCRGAAGLPPDARVVSEAGLAAQALYEIRILVELRVADFSVPNLARYGLDARIFSEYEDALAEYRFGPIWADHLCSLGLDGILYPSRHHTRSLCLALFERDEADLDWQFIGTLLESDRALAVLETVFDWGIG